MPRPRCRGSGRNKKNLTKKSVAHDPLLDHPGTHKLLLLNCSSSITTDDVKTYYQQQMGEDVVACVKWFFNGCETFIGAGFQPKLCCVVRPH